MTDAFFVAGKQAGEWLATVHTIGPWSAEHQHGGPPSALLARALEQEIGVGFRLARVTVELYKPVPVASLQVSSELRRSGRSVRYAVAELHDAQGNLLMQAAGMAIRETTLDFGEIALPAAPRLLPPAQCPPAEFAFFITEVGYHTAMECRLAAGKLGDGPSALWMRMRYPLIDGEAVTPLQRVLCAADSGNGVGMVLDKARFSFINPDLNVQLQRYPQGEWLCLDAGTTPDTAGIGLVDTQLSDAAGPIGRGLQSLLISAV